MSVNEERIIRRLENKIENKLDEQKLKETHTLNVNNENINGWYKPEEYILYTSKMENGYITGYFTKEEIKNIKKDEFNDAISFAVIIASIIIVLFLILLTGTILITKIADKY